MTLGEVLELDVMRRAKPDIVHGTALLDRAVRWVHTNERAEVPSLLKGGELLLTSGLGLADHGPEAQATYVQELAAKNLAALALELGWSFDEVPPEMLAAARECDLPLIALRDVVPFVEITEDIQARIVDRQLTELRLERDVQSQLNGALLREEGLAGVLEAVADILECEVLLQTAADEIVAVAGTSEAHPLALAGSRSAPVRLAGEEWGRLHVLPTPATRPAAVGATLEHGANAVALTLLRTARTVPLRERLSRELVEDLVAGRFQSRPDLEARAGLLGLAFSKRHALVGLAVGGYGPEDSEIASHAARRAVAECGEGLMAEVDGVLVGVVGVLDRHQTQDLADALLVRVEEIMGRRGASRPPIVALGSFVENMESVGRSIRDARDTLALVRDLGLPQRATTARGVATDRLLASVVDERELVAFVDDELGRLIAYDADHGTELVRTLWTFLAYGASKTGAAQALHVRRQSFYQRLDRICELVDGGLDDPERRVSLTLALKAHAVLRRRGRVPG